MDLRDYQHTMLDAARAHLRRGVRRIVLHAPTGSGKTVLTATMLGNAARNGKRSVFAVHRRELLNQSSATFRFAGIPHGIIAAGFAESPQLVQIASIQTLARRLDRLTPPDLLIVDECHHTRAESWSRVVEKWSSSVLIGLTATPQRLDGRGLDEHFDTMVSGPSTAALIEQGWLSPYRIFAPPGIDVTGVHRRAGDFAQDELAARVDKPTITGDAIAHYRKHANGKQALVFAVSIEHSKHVAESFRLHGIAAQHVDGETPPAVRDDYIQAFREGRIRVLSNVSLFGEGLDLSGIHCAILLRPTDSLSLYLQQVGRALRPEEGKREAIILDHAGNCRRHSLPDDEREWSLAGTAGHGSGKQDDVLPAIKTCPQCFAVVKSAVAQCDCGHRFAPEGRIVAVVEGELTEVDVAAMRRTQRAEQGQAATLEQLVALGRARGYKNPAFWAQHVLRARAVGQKRRA